MGPAGDLTAPTARLAADPELGALLTELTAACGRDPLLWRGGSLSGRDVDVVIDAHDLRHATRVLLRHGLLPSDPRSPWGAWVRPDPARPAVDLMPRHRWPNRYQALEGVLRRAVTAGSMPTVAAEDLLLILASDAVAGRDLRKVRVRAGQVVARDPGARARAAELAAREGLSGIWRAAEPDDARMDRSGRLPLLRAIRVAARSAHGRRALRERVTRRASKRWARAVADVRRTAPGRRGNSAVLVALSGMDGSGKSGLAARLEQHLLTADMAATTNWSRLAGEQRTLSVLSGPVKRLLRRRGTIARPLVVAGLRAETGQDGRLSADSGVVEHVWTLIVALVAARTHRRRAAPRRVGTNVVCDRWTADALVDLELRYGRHPVAALALRLLSPTPDLAILLEVGAHVAQARKPHDKALSTLVDMEAAYAARARDLSLFCLDAAQPLEDVHQQAMLLVDRVSGRC